MTKRERERLHRKLDEILDWKPRLLGKPHSRQFCIDWISRTHAMIAKDQRRRTVWVTELAAARYFKADIPWVRDRIEEGEFLHAKQVKGRTMVCLLDS